MKIFLPSGADGYELAHPVHSADFECLPSQLNGTPRRNPWVPFRMQLIPQDEHGRPFQEADAPWLGSDALIFRPSAIEALKPLLLSHGELLPLACEQAPLFAFNPIHVLDALDETASRVHRYPDNGRIFHIEEYVFRPEVVGDVQIFKITSLYVSPTFVRERFVERWQAAGLRGLTFTQVWEG